MSETLTMVRIPYQEYAALYSPMEGLARGTLFQALDKPLDAVGGAPCKPKGKKPWLDYLALGFALDDLRLFLDVNPENREALAEVLTSFCASAKSCAPAWKSRKA